MHFILSLFLAVTAFQYLADLQVVPLSFDGGAFKNAFNASARGVRLVAVFSPT
jgi:hypothetical protein